MTTHATDNGCPHPAERTGTPIISLHNIHKSFGNLEVLKGIDLDIYPREVVSIVGASGAGKSTLLQVIGTFYEPDQGDVRIAGENIGKLSPSQLARFRFEHLGFVFQFHQLLPEFSALENILIPGMIAGRKTNVIRKRAMELLDFMGITERANHKPAQLSGGEKQRVAVARALMNKPDVILADEPSGSLDLHNKEELHNLFFKLRDELGQTFVIVTHDEALARITDRNIRLVDGRIATPE